MRKRHVLAAVEYAKEEFGTVQFLARIEKDNIVSKKVAERLGFVRGGVRNHACDRGMLRMSRGGK